MNKNTCRKQNNGFTLIELMIVVAIIAILVVISIPIFTGKLAEARAATCDANRRSLKAELSSSYMSGEIFNEGLISSATLQRDYGKNFDFDTFCPEDGIITATFDGSSFSVYCSKHSNNSFGNKGVIMSLKDILSKYTVSKMDSGAEGVDDAYTNEFLKELKAAGIDLKKMGAQSWRYNKKDDMLYWSTVDIKDKAVGEAVPTLRYNFNTGTYTVWISKIGKDSVTNGGTEYNVLSGFSGYAPSTNNDKIQSYETALELYNQAVQKYK
ncbi:MAG: prepilin-type N-terminal cleavage/methylation domain-containing protein [Clostridiales bacterium]|nr:prepilin-type N-terminal cleavage/methylation domain-containing protein [Clostridiales bacterium]